MPALSLAPQVRHILVPCFPAHQAKAGSIFRLAQAAVVPVRDNRGADPHRQPGDSMPQLGYAGQVTATTGEHQS